MKLMFITNWMMMGGVETNIVLLTKEFTLLGHNVLVVSSGGELEQDVYLNGGDSFRIEIPSINFLSSVLKLKRTIENWKPDIIHVFSAGGALYLWFAFKFLFALKKPPIVASVMGLQNSPDEPIFKTQLRNFLMTLGACKILIISPEIGNYLRKLPVSEDRLIETKVVGIRMPEVLTEHEKLKVRKELIVGEEEKIVITIGALSPRKSHELFVDAASRVLKDRKDVHFFIVGEGELRSFLEDRIEALGVKANVHLLGLRKDVLRLLSVADICVKPGIVEGFVGITVMEAQSLGVPVVAFDTTDVRLVINDGVTGLIVPKSDPEKLADSIEMLLVNNELARNIGESGRTFIRNTFSISSVAEGLLSLYEEEIKSNHK